MAALVCLEHELKPIRLAITAQKDDAEQLDGFAGIAAFNNTAAVFVSDTLQADRNTLAELKSTEIARRTSAHTVQAGEARLAAYRECLRERSAAPG